MRDGARIQVMRLTNASFKGQISLCNSDFDRLEVRWSALQNRLVYDGVVYLSLAKNFRNLEWFEDADDCYYCYRRLSQSERSMYSRDGKLNWSKMLDALALVSCGYGVRPGYAVIFSGLLIFLFATLYWAGDGITVEPLNGANIDAVEDLTSVDDLYFSAMIFTAKSQVKWYPVGMYRYLATVESVLGWLLMALFLVTLGRTMIR